MALQNIYFVLAQAPVGEPSSTPLQFILHTNIINFMLVFIFSSLDNQKVQCFFSPNREAK